MYKYYGNGDENDHDNADYPCINLTIKEVQFMQ